MNIDLSHLDNKSYASYTALPDLLLTNEFQKVVGWVQSVSAKGVLYDNGSFEFTESGVYTFILERIYQNDDINPDSPPVTIFIEGRKNGNLLFERNAPMSSATANDEPAISSYTSPLTIPVEEGDIFDIFSKAEDNGLSPLATRLIRAQFTVLKIDT